MRDYKQMKVIVVRDHAGSMSRKIQISNKSRLHTPGAAAYAQKDTILGSYYEGLGFKAWGNSICCRGLGQVYDYWVLGPLGLASPFVEDLP